MWLKTGGTSIPGLAENRVRDRGKISLMEKVAEVSGTSQLPRPRPETFFTGWR